MPKIKISFATIIYFLALAFFGNVHFLSLVLAIALHEAGHIICAHLLKIKIKHLILSPLGARMEILNTVSYRDELTLAIAGPFLGMVGFAISVFLSCFWQFLIPFSLISLALSLFNLLPLSTLDGGRILFCLFALVFKLEIAEKIMRFLTFFTLFTIWLFAVYIMIKFAGGLSTFVFCTIFFAKCFIFNAKNEDLSRF